MYLYQLRLRLRAANSVYLKMVVALEFLHRGTEHLVVFIFRVLAVWAAEIAEVIEPVLLTGTFLHRIQMTNLYRYSYIPDWRIRVLDDELNFRRIRRNLGFQLALAVGSFRNDPAVDQQLVLH